MIRNEFIKAFSANLKDEMPEVEYFDLWNQNVEFIEQEEAWDRPAVFLEFLPITWEPVAGGRNLRGRGQVRIHIVTDWVGGNYQQAFAISQGISEMMPNVVCPLFYSIYLQESGTNHNHEDLLETIDTYEVRYMR